MKGAFYGLKKVDTAGKAFRYLLYAKAVFVRENAISYTIPFPHPKKDIFIIKLNSGIPFPDCWHTLKQFYEAIASDYICLDYFNRKIIVKSDSEKTYIIECLSDVVIIKKNLFNINAKYPDRGEADAWSDIDLYCLFDKHKLKTFLEKRICYLEQYKPLIYHKEVYFVAPQIGGVYNDGLHIDLYTVTYDFLPQTDQIKILYDPENILNDYPGRDLMIEKTTFIEYFDYITFTLLEFEAAYCRKDFLWASRLGYDVFTYLCRILRYIYDRKNAQLGLKRLHKKLDCKVYENLYRAADLLGPSEILMGVTILLEITLDIMKKIPHDLLQKINLPFFMFFTERIKDLHKR